MCYFSHFDCLDGEGLIGLVDFQSATRTKLRRFDPCQTAFGYGDVMGLRSSTMLASWVAFMADRGHSCFLF